MKIQVIGISGVGKTYLSKKLKNKLNLKHTQIDNIIFKKKYSKINKNFQVNLKKIISKKNLILDGTYLDYDLENYKKFDLIIILKINIFENLINILKRFHTKKYYNLKNLFLNFKLIFRTKFKENKKIKKHNDFIIKNCKYKILKNKKEIEDFIKKPKMGFEPISSKRS